MCICGVPFVRLFLFCRQEERRGVAIQKAKGQLVKLREGLQGLRDAAREDGRPAVEDAVAPTIQNVRLLLRVVS